MGYTLYNPKQLSTVEEKVIKYRGRETLYLRALREKYCQVEQDPETKQMILVSKKKKKSEVEENEEEMEQTMKRIEYRTIVTDTVETREISFTKQDLQQDQLRRDAVF